MKKRRAEREAAKAAKEGDGEEAGSGRRRGQGAGEARAKADTAHPRAANAPKRPPKAEAGRPLFISLEGIDGSGKSTQAKLLAEELGPETVSIREPGGTGGRRADPRAARRPRPRARPASPSCCSSSAARADLTARVIRPALEAGRDVVADRFADSSVAYQGGARGLGRRRGALAHRHRDRRPLARPHAAAAGRPRGRPRAGPTATIASSPRASSCSAPSPRPTRRSPRSPPTGSS